MPSFQSSRLRAIWTTNTPHDSEQRPYEPSGSCVTLVSYPQGWLNDLNVVICQINEMENTSLFHFVRPACEAVQVLLSHISLLEDRKQQYRALTEEVVGIAQLMATAFDEIPRGGMMYEKYQELCKQFTSTVQHVTTILSKRSRLQKGLGILSQHHSELKSVCEKITTCRDELMRIASLVSYIRESTQGGSNEILTTPLMQ